MQGVVFFLKKNNGNWGFNRRKLKLNKTMQNSIIIQLIFGLVMCKSLANA
jgi:phage gp46-like protein